MPDNPYLVPSGADDDIFNPQTEEFKSKHVYDGTPCSECNGIIHNAAVDEGVPIEVQEELDRILDSMPQEERGSLIIATTPESPASQILKDIQDFFVSFDSTIAVGPALRACIEVLDQITQNQLSVLVNVYAKEQTVIVYQDQVRLLNSMLKRIGEWTAGDNTPSLSTLKDVLSDIQKGIESKLSQIIEAYVQACNQAERNPRQDLLDGHLEGDPEDIRFKLMFHHISSSMVRDFMSRQEPENHQEESEQQERTQASVSTDGIEAG